jgi:hypothetical protein
VRDEIPPFTGVHDPILVPAAKFDSWWDLWKWWCPCGRGAKSADTYEGASTSGTAHAEAKNAKA